MELPVSTHTCIRYRTPPDRPPECGMVNFLKPAKLCFSVS
jgi:hypothetical protein